MLHGRRRDSDASKHSNHPPFPPPNPSAPAALPYLVFYLWWLIRWRSSYRLVPLHRWAGARARHAALELLERGPAEDVATFPAIIAAESQEVLLRKDENTLLAEDEGENVRVQLQNALGCVLTIHPPRIPAAGDRTWSLHSSLGDTSGLLATAQASGAESSGGRHAEALQRPPSPQQQEEEAPGAGLQASGSDHRVASPSGVLMESGGWAGGEIPPATPLPSQQHRQPPAAAAAAAPVAAAARPASPLAAPPRRADNRTSGAALAVPVPDPLALTWRLRAFELRMWSRCGWHSWGATWLDRVTNPSHIRKRAMDAFVVSVVCSVFFMWCARGRGHCASSTEGLAFACGLFCCLRSCCPAPCSSTLPWLRCSCTLL